MAPSICLSSAKRTFFAFFNNGLRSSKILCNHCIFASTLDLFDSNILVIKEILFPFGSMFIVHIFNNESRQRKTLNLSMLRNISGSIHIDVLYENVSFLKFYFKINLHSYCFIIQYCKDFVYAVCNICCCLLCKKMTRAPLPLGWILIIIIVSIAVSIFVWWIWSRSNRWSLTPDSIRGLSGTTTPSGNFFVTPVPGKFSNDNPPAYESLNFDESLLPPPSYPDSIEMQIFIAKNDK